MPPRKTSLEPGTPSGARRRARPCTTRRSRASSRARGSGRARAPRPRARRAREVPRRARSDERRLELVSARLGARLDDEVDVDLEVARADRHLEPVAVAARVRKRLRDLPTRRAPKKRRVRRSGGVPARARAARRRLRARAARAAAAPTAGPGSDDRPASRARRGRGRRGAGEAEDDAALGHASPACVTPSAKSAYGRLSRSATCARRPRSAPRAPRRRACPSPATFASDLDRAVVVGRPEPAGASRRGPLRRRPRATRGLELARDRRRRSWIRAGSTPSASSERARKGPFRSVRSPRTSSLPVTTMTARGRAPFAPVKLRRPRRSSSPSRRRPAP